MVVKYVLTENGKSARDALLMTLLNDCRPSIKAFNTRFRKAGLTTPDKECVSTLIGNNEKSFPLKAVENFFKLSIKLIEREHRCNVDIPHLAKLQSVVGLNNYFNLCIEHEKSTGDSFAETAGKMSSWEIPKGLEGWISISRTNCDPKFLRKVSEALNCLNCETQISDFKTAVNKNRYFYIFPVVAPTPITQNWLLNRLVSNLNQRSDSRNEGAVKTYLINLDSEAMDYVGLLDLVIERLNIPVNLPVEDSDNCSKKDLLVKEICEFSNSLNVLIVTDFEEYSNTLREFAIDLNACFNSKEYENAYPRLIIFCVGRSIPSCYEGLTEPRDGHFHTLDPLIEINYEHIKHWASDRDSKHKILRNIRVDAIQPRWTEPQTILDIICKQLGADGITTISKQWK